MTDLPRPIFIVGQYKCGTSWFQRSIAAHPDVVGVSEFDVVKATCSLTKTHAHLRPTDERLAEYFDRSGWCTRWDGEKWLLRDSVARLARGDSHAQRALNPGQLQKFDNLSPEGAATLYQRVRDATHPFEAMNAWLQAVSEQWPDKKYIVVKAADLIAGFRVLQAWQPEAPKLFITRDGRDASISEEHFRALMADRDAPWFRHRPDRDYDKRLHVWAVRAALAAEYAGRGSLRMQRYEDLSSNFRGTMSTLFDELGLDSSDHILADIEEQTSFRRMASRDRGEEARSNIRKGSTGEFLEVLSTEQQDRAWDQAGAPLEALGYGRDGSVGPITDRFTEPGRGHPTERAESSRGWIRAKPNPRPAHDGRRHRVKIQWATADRSPGFVGVRTVRNGEKILFRGPKGSRKVGWVRPERSFVLTLYADEALTDAIARIILRRDDDITIE